MQSEINTSKKNLDMILWKDCLTLIIVGIKRKILQVFLFQRKPSINRTIYID